MTVLSRGLTLACLGTLLALGTGCQNDRYESTDVNNDVKFDVMASNTEIMSGDVVTFTTRSQNTLGRDAKVRWTSTGGKLDAEEGGRIARATFDKPGTYTVTGRLEVDGQVLRSDSVDVRVKAVR